MIPKIIHQTWKTKSIPQKWRCFSETWQQKNPDWEYRLWTDEDCEEFVAQHYSRYLNTYRSLPYNILRADLFRYLVLAHYGGLYADLDTECLQSFSTLTKDKSFIVCKEPKMHALRLSSESMIGNAIIAAAPKHPFLVSLLEHLYESLNKANSKQTSSIITHHDVLESTGPLMLHKAFTLYQKSDITVLDSESFYPFDNYQAKRYLAKADFHSDREVRNKLVSSGSYCIHYWDNSWTKNLAGKLTNNNPKHLEGYVFFQGKDSLGFDFGNQGRVIEEVARIWDQEDKVAGFNTDGFAKYYIHPPYRWRRISKNPQPNEGLYIKEELVKKPFNRYFAGFGRRRLA